MQHEMQNRLIEHATVSTALLHKIQKANPKMVLFSNQMNTFLIHLQTRIDACKTDVNNVE